MRTPVVACLAAAIAVAWAAQDAGAARAPERRIHVQVGYAFDLPAGWRADTTDAHVTLVLPPSENVVAFGVQVDDTPCPAGGGPGSNRLNALLACVRERFQAACDFVGGDANRAPERLRSIRYRGRRGVDVIEFTNEIAEGPSWDDEEDAAMTEGAPPAEDADTPEAAPEVTRRYAVGPAFMVDLSAPGRTLRLWVLPICDGPPGRGTVEAMRVVVGSLSRR